LPIEAGHLHERFAGEQPIAADQAGHEIETRISISQMKPVVTIYLGMALLAGCTPSPPPQVTAATPDLTKVCLNDGRPYSRGAELNGLVCQESGFMTFDPKTGVQIPTVLQWERLPRQSRQ
jgi:hypothetical protein